MRSFFAVAASVTSTGATTYTAGDSTHHAPNCYGFPNKPFTPTNYVNICDPSGCLDEGLGVKSGDIAPNSYISEISYNGLALALRKPCTAPKDIPHRNVLRCKVKIRLRTDGFVFVSSLIIRFHSLRATGKRVVDKYGFGSSGMSLEERE